MLPTDRTLIRIALALLALVLIVVFGVNPVHLLAGAFVAALVRKLVVTAAAPNQAHRDGRR